MHETVKGRLHRIEHDLLAFDLHPGELVTVLGLLVSHEAEEYLACWLEFERRYGP